MKPARGRTRADPTHHTRGRSPSASLLLERALGRPIGAFVSYPACLQSRFSGVGFLGWAFGKCQSEGVERT